jgi:TIR domain
MPTKRKLRVFLCHASQDKPVVRDLYRRLKSETWIDPWLDEERLLPGQDWNLEIEKAVESSDAVIVCVSSTSVAKEGYVQKELRQVLNIALEKLEGAIFVLPVKLDDCPLPRQLKDKQALDYFPASQQAAAYDKLKASLKIRKDHLEI